LRGFLAGPFRRLGLGVSGTSADAAPQRLHQIDDVLAARSLLRPDRLASALLVDEVDQSRLVVVLELVGLEAARLLVHDVLGEIEHVLGDFDILDLIEIFALGADFVGIVTLPPSFIQS
jgi:hypothetical protein